MFISKKQINSMKEEIENLKKDMKECQKQNEIKQKRIEKLEKFVDASENKITKDDVLSFLSDPMIQDQYIKIQLKLEDAKEEKEKQKEIEKRNVRRKQLGYIDYSNETNKYKKMFLETQNGISVLNRALSGKEEYYVPGLVAAYTALLIKTLFFCAITYLCFAISMFAFFIVFNRPSSVLFQIIGILFNFESFVIFASFLNELPKGSKGGFLAITLIFLFVGLLMRGVVIDLYHKKYNCKDETGFLFNLLRRK